MESKNLQEKINKFQTDITQTKQVIEQIKQVTDTSEFQSEIEKLRRKIELLEIADLCIKDSGNDLSAKDIQRVTFLKEELENEPNGLAEQIVAAANSLEENLNNDYNEICNLL